MPKHIDSNRVSAGQREGALLVEARAELPRTRLGERDKRKDRLRARHVGTLRAQKQSVGLGGQKMDERLKRPKPKKATHTCAGGACTCDQI